MQARFTRLSVTQGGITGAEALKTRQSSREAPSRACILSGARCIVTRCVGAGDEAGTAARRSFYLDGPMQHSAGFVNNSDQESTSRPQDIWDGMVNAAEPIPPSPASQPRNSDELHSSLRRNQYWTPADRPGINLLDEGSAGWKAVTHVHVILFGGSQKEQEGIYSLRAAGHEGLPQETIIVFEGQQDAERYAAMLEVTMDPHTPRICEIQIEDLTTFCHDRGYLCRLEPTGSLLIPPDFNVGLTDWERAKKLRGGCFDVLEVEPTGSSENLESDSSCRSTSQVAVRPGSQSEATLAAASFAPYEEPMTEQDLEVWRSRLESLLPPARDRRAGHTTQLCGCMTDE